MHLVFSVAVGLGGFFVVFCFPYRARRPWYFCIWQRVCVRQGRVNEDWCVSGRSPGDAAGKLLIQLVWSWKLTRSHWKWLPLGISFILVYLFFSFPFPKFFTHRKGFDGCRSSRSLWLDYNLLLHLMAFVSCCTFWCCTWVGGGSKGDPHALEVGTCASD